MNELYPAIKPYNHQLLSVSEGHQVYVEQCGNPEGIPILFVHGGPGQRLFGKRSTLFDPDVFRIVLFDQRGCGRSLPHGCLEENTTELLVEDIELIRQHLGIEQWHVFGGSWGSTLALVYAQAYPQPVLSLTLRGIFLARPEDSNWLFSGGGATRIYPDAWHDYMQAVPFSDGSDNVKLAYDILLGDDKALAMKVAKAWTEWEVRCSTLSPVAIGDLDENYAWTHARHEAHFMANDCFLMDNQILNNCHKIAHIPTTIVHGRFDIVCAIDNAWLLHRALPNSKFIVAEAAGHASMEPNTRHHLIAATKAIGNC